MTDCYSNGSPCGSVKSENPYTYIHQNGLATEQEYPTVGKKETCKFHPQMAVVKVKKMNYLDQEETHPILSGNLEDAL